MREFKTKPKPPKPPVEFSIDDREMIFNPPGWAPLLLMQSTNAADVTRSYLDWLGAGLSDEDGQHILDRLTDPNDEFDLEDITEVFLGVIQEVTGRPTVPPTDSSGLPDSPDLTAGRHLVASTQPS